MLLTKEQIQAEYEIYCKSIEKKGRKPMLSLDDFYMSVIHSLQSELENRSNLQTELERKNESV